MRQEVVYQPAKLYVKDIYRNTYECRNYRKNGKTFMIKAGTPAPVIPHSFTSSSVLSQIVIDKYVNHMPLYRQESEWKRFGTRYITSDDGQLDNNIGKRILCPAGEQDA